MTERIIRTGFGASNGKGEASRCVALAASPAVWAAWECLRVRTCCTRSQNPLSPLHRGTTHDRHCTFPYRTVTIALLWQKGPPQPGPLQQKVSDPPRRLVNFDSYWDMLGSRSSERAHTPFRISTDPLLGFNTF